MTPTCDTCAKRVPDAMTMPGVQGAFPDRVVDGCTEFPGFGIPNGWRGFGGKGCPLHEEATDGR